MGFVAQLARCVVGGSLILSTTWKIRHPSSFRASLRSSSPAWLRNLDSLAVVVTVVAEIALALALLAPWNGSRTASGLALGLLLVFTAFLLRSPSAEGGCGCWRVSRTDKPTRSAFVLRNVLLMGFAVAGLALPSPTNDLRLLVAVPIGLLVSLLIMESPHITTSARSTAWSSKEVGIQ